MLRHFLTQSTIGIRHAAFYFLIRGKSQIRLSFDVGLGEQLQIHYHITYAIEEVLPFSFFLHFKFGCFVEGDPAIL